ncbi:MAG: hypothetical protein O9346_15850 [Leptospiraceae bacterium]|nr:hypothetical protein [Leptospiraceae bacterium]MCZ8347885.1 hypothetical protein [Leptospiraceae bacterium]
MLDVGIWDWSSSATPLRRYFPSHPGKEEKISESKKLVIFFILIQYRTMMREMIVCIVIFSLANIHLIADETSNMAAFNSCMKACYRKSDTMYSTLSVTSFIGTIAAFASGKGLSGSNRSFDYTNLERNPTEPRYNHCYSSCKYENPNFDTTKDGDIHPKYDNSLYNFLNRDKMIK